MAADNSGTFWGLDNCWVESCEHKEVATVCELCGVAASKIKAPFNAPRKRSWQDALRLCCKSHFCAVLETPQCPGCFRSPCSDNSDGRMLPCCRKAEDG